MNSISEYITFYNSQKVRFLLLYDLTPAERRVVKGLRVIRIKSTVMNALDFGKILSRILK
jgi:hypothetical protein